MFAVAITSIATNIGILFGNQLAKYIAVGCQAYVLYKSFWCISTLKSFYNRDKAFAFMFLIALIPLSRILAFSVQGFDFKTFTDAVIIQGSYYQLVFPALAMALLTKGKLGAYVLYRYAVIAFPIGVALGLYTLVASSESNISVGHIPLTNCFIPASLLAMYPSKRSRLVLGWISIMFVLFLASKIWSRSYTLVGVYLALMALISTFRTGQRKIGFTIIAVGLLAYFSGVFSFFSETSVVQESSLEDKYQFDTLLKSFSQFMTDGDFVKLFFWEGNSRSEILIDAFGGFDFWDWMFGRGIGGTYTSFIERSTIEVGWAQELFRWGCSYMITLLILMIYTYRRLRRQRDFKTNPMLRMLAGIILVKFLDGFIFGLPQSTIYNLLVFWGIMSLTVHSKTFEIRKVSIGNKKVKYDFSA